MDIGLVIVWTLFWFVGMGVPNYLFGKGKTTYCEHPVRNSLWYFLASAAVVGVYYQNINEYFAEAEMLHVLLGAFVLSFWFSVWKLYPRDQYVLKERLKYQFTKVFDILLQQVTFLAGFLLFGYEWYIFGIIFFLIHLPVPLIIPKQFGLITMFAALPGGLVFAYLHSMGVSGFLVAVAVHFGFYAVLPFVLGSRWFPDLKPIRR